MQSIRTGIGGWLRIDGDMITLRQDKHTLEREKRLVHYTKSVSRCIAAGADKEIAALLHDAQSEHEFSYYAVYKNGAPTFTAPEGHTRF